MMYKLSNEDVIPLYIGKTGEYGYTENLSANIKNIEIKVSFVEREVIIDIILEV